MADKKRKSKRVSTRQRMKILKKIKKHHKDKRKEFKKLNKNKIKLPLHVRMPEEDILQLREIKSNEKLRAEQFDGHKIDFTNKPDYIFALDKLLESNDVVFEVVDMRDPIESRSIEIENYIKSKKELILILNRANAIPKENLQKWIEHFNNNKDVFILPDKHDEFMAPFSKRKVAIIGHPKSGKNFVYQKFTMDSTNTFDSNLLTIPVKNTTISNILRESIIFSDHIYKPVLCEFFQTIELNKLAIVFGIPYFENYYEFVMALKEKYKLLDGIKSSVYISATRIFLDHIKNGTIAFYRSTDDFNKIVLAYNGIDFTCTHNCLNFNSGNLQ